MAEKIRKLLKEAFVTIAFLVIFMTGYNIYLQKDIPSTQAPELKAVTISGQTINLEQLSSDKPVLLYFWATWCQVCSWTSPAVSDLSEDYQVLTVALTSGTDERLNAYRTAKDLLFPVINDNTGRLAKQWGVNVTPSLVVIHKGKIKSVTNGFTTKSGISARLWLAR